MNARSLTTSVSPASPSGQTGLLQRSGKRENCEECQRKSGGLAHRSINRPIAHQSAAPQPSFSELPVLLQDVLQAKLTIGQPGDKYEQEADRVAEQVMQMPETTVLTNRAMAASGEPPTIQRACSKCRRAAQQLSIEEDEEERLRAKPMAGQRPTIRSTTHPSLSALQGSGQPLPSSERAFFEPRFGADFSQVRIHTDLQAGRLARALNAKAFTVGQDIVFCDRLQSLTSPERRSTLAHELVHVIQQNERLSVESYFQMQPFKRSSLTIKESASQLMLMRISEFEENQGISDMLRLQEDVLRHYGLERLGGPNRSDNLAIVRVLNNNGESQLGRGAHLHQGSIPSELPHAEERAVVNVRTRLGPRLENFARGGRMIVITTQDFCPAGNCQAAITNLARDMGIDLVRIEAFRITRSNQLVHGITALHSHPEGLRLSPLPFRAVGSAERWNEYQRIRRLITRFLRNPRYRAMLARAPLYLGILMNLLNLLGTAGTACHIFDLWNYNTIRPEVQRAANQILNIASDDKNDIERMFEEEEAMNPGFLIQLGEMLANGETTHNLAAILASLRELRDRVEDLARTRRIVLRDLQDRHDRTWDISRQFLANADDWSIALVGLTTPFVALHISYQSLSGTFGSACTRLEEALQILEPMGQYLEGLEGVIANEIERQELRQRREPGYQLIGFIINRLLEDISSRIHSANEPISTEEEQEPPSSSSSLPSLESPPEESTRPIPM
jgi:hypothetical protein